jgi:23S rRNA (cytidine1920-2'-O)/16S rRNA (cytidine1409-2'-O)-methyltransferase
MTALQVLAMPLKPRADLELVRRGFFESRARAQSAILAGLVRVDGRALVKPSDTIAPDATIEAEAPHPFVSRGGVKLSHALDRFGVDPHGVVALDCGASTGGFTDALLQRGARHVIAVDVGHGQLHARLLADPRVTNAEGCDIRTFRIPDGLPPPALITVDVSFISLAQVLPALLALAATPAVIIALIKPQFEAGRKHLKKGIVRDAAIRTEVCESMRRLFVEHGLAVRGVAPSPLVGGDGNEEFLMVADRTLAP